MKLKIVHFFIALFLFPNSIFAHTLWDGIKIDSTLKMEASQKNFESKNTLVLRKLDQMWLQLNVREGVVLLGKLVELNGSQFEMDMILVDAAGNYFQGPTTFKVDGKLNVSSKLAVTFGEISATIDLLLNKDNFYSEN